MKISYVNARKFRCFLFKTKTICWRCCWMMLSLGEVSVEISWCRPRLYLDVCWSKQSVSICQRVVDNVLLVVQNKSTTSIDRCLVLRCLMRPRSRQMCYSLFHRRSPTFRWTHSWWRVSSVFTTWLLRVLNLRVRRACRMLVVGW